jgi:hypothetical protein
MARERKRKMSTAEKIGIGLALWWWFGGGGLGLGSTSGTIGLASGKRASWARPPIPRIRVDANGYSIDGRKVTVDQALALAQAAGAADLVITGDAKEGDVDAMRAALAKRAGDIGVHDASKR